MLGKSTIPSNNKAFGQLFKSINTIDFWILSSVFVLTFLVFFPSLTNDFVNWDDDVNLLDNPFVSNLSLESIAGIFSSTILGNYNPFPIFTFAIEHYFFGANPFVFHFNNLLIHLVSVGLVFRIAKRVGCTGFGAGLATAIFAIHPMHVESVAWISQRKDLLFGLFFLAGIFSYLNFIAKNRKGKGLFWVYLFFILSCLSKIQAVSFPLVLIGLDYLLEKKWEWNLLRSKIGLLSISLVVGIGGILALNSYGSIDHHLFSFIERLAIGAYSFSVYIFKFFFPKELSAVYPYPSEISNYYHSFLFPLAAFFYLLLWSFRTKKKRLFFVAWMFLVNIIFVLQFLGAGQAFLADRFTYIPYIGLAIGSGYLLNDFIKRFPQMKLGFYILTVLLLLIFSKQSHHQTKVWKDSNSLWTKAIELNPELHIGYHNRGIYFSQNQAYDKALTDLSKAIAFSTTKSNYYNSRAKVYVAKGQLNLALTDYNKAIELQPTLPEYLSNRSVALAMMERYKEGLHDLNKSLTFDPNYSEAYLNRALVFAYTGQFEKALNDNLSYLKYFPNAQEIWVEAGMNARLVGKKAAADQYLKRALSLKPNDSNAMEELALLK